MLPPAVTAAAAAANNIPRPLAAANAELAAGAVSKTTIQAMVALISVAGPHPALGGEPGAWWAALQTPVLPQSHRTRAVDDWATTRIAAATDDVFRAAAAGTVNPTVTRDWDRDTGQALDRFHAALVEAVVDALNRVARLAGSHVMAWCRDPAVRERLEPHDLRAVPLVASGLTVTAGRTVWQAAHVDLDSTIDTQARALESNVRRIVDNYNDEMSALVLALFGVAGGVVADREAVVTEIINRFLLLARRIPDVGVPKSVAGVATTGIEAGVPPGRVVRALTVAVSTAAAAAAVGVAEGGRVDRFIQAVTLNRLQLREQRRFVWGKHGKSDNPHPVHKGEADGRTEAELAAAGLDWVHPGDHEGCRCGWRRQTVVTVTP